MKCGGLFFSCGKTCRGCSGPGWCPVPRWCSTPILSFLLCFSLILRSRNGSCTSRNGPYMAFPVVRRVNGDVKRCGPAGCASLFFFLKGLYLFIWLRWVFIAAHGLSLVVVSGGYSSLRCTGFSLQWLLLLQSTGSRHAGSVIVARGL